MRGFKFLGCFLFCILLGIVCKAQQIQGQVIDFKTSATVEGVRIENIFTGITVTTDGEGGFKIAASKGHLLEFKKMGYKTLRLRIPEGTLPPFFKIALEEGAFELPELLVQGPPKNYHDDSIKYYNLYKHQLEFSRLKGYESIQHPFSAMSKKNRQIWAFQEHYEWFQREKYINFNFNEKLIADITGLNGDSVQLYMQMFRPTYEELRAMNEYNYFNYIKKTVEIYRERGIRSKMSPVRNSG